MKSARAIVSALAFSAALTVAGASWATPESDLSAAENAYAALDFPAAATAADEVLAQRGLSHDLLTRATRVSALAHAALGNSEQAKKLFILLLAYEPDFKVDPKLGPRFSDPFAEARGYWQAQGRKPGMDVETFVQWHQRGQIRATVRDPLGTVKRLSIGYRWVPAREYTTSSGAGTLKEIDIAPNPGGSSRLEYYVRAVDAKDNAIFEEGSPDQPKGATVTEPVRAGGEDKGSFFASPLFLASGGVVLAAAGVVGYFLLRPTTYDPSPTARGVVGASCGAARCQ